MELFKSIERAFFNSTLAPSIIATFTDTAVIGNDATERSTPDGWSNFVLGLMTKTFTKDATVTEWQVYANNPGNLGLLLLRNTEGSTYEIVGADFEEVTEGLNTFSFTPDTGAAEVMAGDIIGLYIGTAKVKFDFVAGDNPANWCGSNGCISDASAQLAAGQTVALTGGPQGRTYSANVTAVSPAPGPSLIVLLALGVLLLLVLWIIC